MHTHKPERRPRLVDTEPEEREDLADGVEAEGEIATGDTQPTDTGELYGVHTSTAEDRELSAPEAEDSFADAELGENWLEALETRSVEGGPLPEHEIVIVDDSDPSPPPTDFRDRPKADRGSGGRGGL